MKKFVMWDDQSRRIGERNDHKGLVRKHEGKGLLEGLRRRREDNIAVYHKQIGYGGVY